MIPLYTYECECGCRLVDLQKMPGKPKVTCPDCGKQAVRIISPCSVRFKGTGFHETDYDAYGPKKKEEKKEGTEDA